MNQTKFCVTWYTVDAAGIGEPFHNEIVQEDNNGTIISRLKSACNQSSNVNGCYTGKKSLKVRD